MCVEGLKIVLRLCGSECALLTVEIVGAKPASQAIPLSARTLHLKHARTSFHNPVCHPSNSTPSSFSHKPQYPQHEQFKLD